MDDAMKDLGRRAIAAGFAWVPGCANQYGERVTRVVRHMNGADIEAWDPRAFGWTSSESYIGGDDVPDFSDPATLGCLLAQVRELWEDRGLSVCGIYEAGVWVWMFNEGKPHGASFYRARSVRQPSEAAALVAALEAAPKAAP